MRGGVYGTYRTVGESVCRQARGSPSAASPCARHLALTCVFVAFFCAGSASARDLFTTATSVGGGLVKTLSAKEARSVLDWFDAAIPQQIQSGCDAARTVAAMLEPHGISTAAAFKAWLEGSYGDAADSTAPRTFQARVAELPVDSVAGEGYTRADRFDVYAISAPIDPQYDPGDRFTVLMDLPFAFTSADSTWSGTGPGGLGLRIAPTSWWQITPTARVGGAGSADAGALQSGSLTSEIRVPLGPLAIGVGNTGGIAKSIDGVELSGYEIEYKIANPMVRNGLWLEGSFGSDSMGSSIGWRVGASDVRFFGDDFYTDNYQEVITAFAYGGFPLPGLQVELAYRAGRHTRGVNARLGLRF